MAKHFQPSKKHRSQNGAGPSRRMHPHLQEVDEDTPIMNNWTYSLTNPPVLRNSRLGGNWRHMAQCNSHNGTHLVFVDGMVKQVDALRFPPYGSQDAMPSGIPNTFHNPTAQLRAHGATAQARLMQMPPGQRYYEIGQGGLDPNAFIDPFSAYRMGIQHGLGLKKGTGYDDSTPSPPPPKKRLDAWNSETQVSRCNSARVPSRAGSQLQVRPSTACVREDDDAPKKTTKAPKNMRNPSDICLDIEKACKTLPSAKSYVQYNYNLQPQKKKKTKQTMASYRVMGVKSDNNIPAPWIGQSTYQYFR